MTKLTAAAAAITTTAVLGLGACGGDSEPSSGDGPTGDPTEAAGPTVEDVVACLTEAGREAEEVDAETRRRVEVRYSFDTTHVDFLDSAEAAEEELAFGESYDLEDFTVGSVYVLLGSLDEDALADRATIEGCLT